MRKTSSKSTRKALPKSKNKTPKSFGNAEPKPVKPGLQAALPTTAVIENFETGVRSNWNPADLYF